MVGDERALPDGWVLPGYEHIQELGSGAGGYVWLARHSVTGTLVAVKYLVPGLLAGSVGFREAYRSEAQLLAELDSPYVARLYEYVEGPPGAAIVMEAVEGRSLRALMTSEATATSPEAALCILKGSLLGLAAAHDAGVVHRDYKPANVLVTPDGLSKLVDFGIAARTGSAAAAAGTPIYMAPEQFHGAPASPSTDVYAATATFFECVTGVRPFPGTNAVELMAQHTLGHVPDDLAPPTVRSLIRKGMAKDPLERPPSAREFVTRLEAVAGAAYGPDWEERGQRKLATLVALSPLLLLLGHTAPAVPASTTSVATTVLGQEPPTIMITPPEPPGSAEPARRGGRLRRRGHRHSAQISIGAAVLGMMLVIAGAAVAAYAAHKPSSASAHEANAAVLTGATTEVTAGNTIPFTLAPIPSGSGSSSASASMSAASASLTPSASASSTVAGSTTLPPTSSTTTSTPPPSTASHPASTTPPPTPEIKSLAISQLSCPSNNDLQATVAVTSNGQGGTLTLSWFYDTVTGAEQAVGTTTYNLAAGQTSQTVTPSAEDFSQYTDYSTWGVTISSAPAVSTGSNPTDTINPSTTNNCLQTIS